MRVQMPKTYKKNTLVFEEGEEIYSLYYLLEGKLGLVHRIETDNKEYELVSSQIENNTFFAVENYFETKFADYTVKALEESTINETPIKSKEDIEKLIKEKPAFGMQILRSLLKTIAQTANCIIQFKKLYSSIAKLEAIGLGSVGYLAVSQNLKSFEGKIADDAKEIYESFKNSKIDLFPLTQGVFSAPFDQIIGEDISCAEDLDKKEVNFFTKLYTLNTDLQSQLYTKEPFFVFYFLEKASLHFTNLLKSIEMSFKKIMEKHQNLLRPQGILHTLLSMRSQFSGNGELIKYIKLVVSTILTNTLKLSLPLKDNIPDYYNDLAIEIEKLKDFSLKEVESANGKDSAGVEKAKIDESYTMPEELKGGLEKILKYANLDPDVYKQFKQKYAVFKTIKEKLSGDDDVRNKRKAITNLFWEIYEKCFINYYHSASCPRPVELMLRYGFFDEELISNKTASLINDLKPEPVTEDLPIYDAFQWLEAIMSQKIAPSINAMGETYEKHLREEAKRRSIKTLVTPEELDKVDNRLQFEIRNMIRECSRICSGELFNYSPILMDEAFAGQFEKYVPSKKKFKEEFFKIKSTDFSAFYREVMYRHPELNTEEIIQKEVMPNILMLPSWGKRTMVWQVKERQKDSRGRVVFPFIIIENMRKMIIESYGIYRWEILKEVLGPSWNDISQLTLTAEFMDYIQFFKKNKDLTIETKEKIALDFKKARTDRDKFTNDYIKWIEMESEGRPQLNKVVRSILFRHVPFPKAIRDKLKDLPAYVELYQKYINLQRKEIISLRNKYQKYTKTGKPLPPELEQNINLHVM